MVRWRITPHGQRSYWVINIAEGTKSRQGIVHTEVMRRLTGCACTCSSAASLVRWGLVYSPLTPHHVKLPQSQFTIATDTFCFHPGCDSSQARFRRPSFHSYGSCAFFIPPVSLVEQTRRWSGALKTSGTDDEADRRSRHVESCEHNTHTRDDTRKRSREALRPPQPGWK